RLGTPEQLAAVARDQLRRSSFAGRHPVLTFVAAPVATVMGCLIAMILAVLIITESASWLRAAHGPLSDFDLGLLFCINQTARFVPFVVSTWIFARMARRSDRVAWSASACGVVALMGLLFTSTVMPPTPDSDWMWVVDVINWKPDLDHVLQAVVPLAL